MRLLFMLSMIVALGVWMTPTTHASASSVLEVNGLLLPDGNRVQGVVEIHGIAQHATFRKWQIDLQLNGNAAETTFVAVSETQQADVGPLTTLDTTLYPNGAHLLRLRVVHSNLNYDEYFTPITIENTMVSSEAGTIAPSEEDEPTATPLLLDQPLGANVSDGERRIEVDLSDQTLTAWQGDTAVLHTSVSTGRAEYPTVIGTWPIRVKLTSTRMIGPGYDTPNVPWTMYFFRGYAVHGAYWHDDFGTPVSHGCINMRPDEAKLLFDWASEGTNVTVHE